MGREDLGNYDKKRLGAGVSGVCDYMYSMEDLKVAQKKCPLTGH